MLSKKKQQVTKGSERYDVQGNPKNTPNVLVVYQHMVLLLMTHRSFSPREPCVSVPEVWLWEQRPVRVVGFASEQPRLLWALLWAPPRTGLRAQTAGHRQQLHVHLVILGKRSTEAVSTQDSTGAARARLCPHRLGRQPARTRGGGESRGGGCMCASWGSGVRCARARCWEGPRG